MLNDSTLPPEVQWVLLLALMAVTGFLLITVSVLARRSRKRRAERDAIAHRFSIHTKTELERMAGDGYARAFGKTEGRMALWRREMAQNELDRFNGKRADKDVEPDPTFEEWCTEKGLLDEVETSA